jgi:hypothetical protein
MRELRCGCLTPGIEKVLLLCEYAIHIGRIVLMFLTLLVERKIPSMRCQGPGRFPSSPILRELVYNMRARSIPLNTPGPVCVSLPCDRVEPTIAAPFLRQRSQFLVQFMVIIVFGTFNRLS